MATVGIALVITTGLITGLVVVNWSGYASDSQESPQPTPAVSSRTPRDTLTGIRSNRAVSKSPNATDVLEKAVIGGGRGAGVGAAGGVIAGDGGGAGKGTAIGGIVGSTAGSYGPHGN